MPRSAASFVFGIGGALVFAGAAAASTGDGIAPRSAFAPALEIIGIRDIQTLLRSHGYDPGPATGAVNDATTRAIIAYQRDYGLPPDGVAGPLVQNALHFLRRRVEERRMEERRFLERRFLQGRLPPPAADGHLVFAPPEAASGMAEVPPMLAAPEPVTPPAAAPLEATLSPPAPDNAAAAPDAAAPLEAPPPPSASANAGAPEAAAPLDATLPPLALDSAPAAPEAAAPEAVPPAADAAEAAPAESAANDMTAEPPAPIIPAPPPAVAEEAPPLQALPPGDVVAMAVPPPPPAPPDEAVTAVVPPPLAPPPPAPAAPAVEQQAALAAPAPGTVPMGVLGPLDPKPIPSPRTAVASGPIPDRKSHGAVPVAPPTPAAVAGDAALAPGDAAVREAQTYLKELGFYGGAADGVLNWPTVDALVKFDASGAGPHEVIADAGHLDSVWLARLKTAAAAKAALAPPH
jgi:peptidoglycan hydrolase-like protein with peptidoglycan-binding domain